MQLALKSTCSHFLRGLVLPSRFSGIQSVGSGRTLVPHQDSNENQVVGAGRRKDGSRKHEGKAE